MGLRFDLAAWQAKQGTLMNGHAKALMAFFAVHGIVTGGGLLFDKVTPSLRQVTKDNYAHDVGEVL
ncbi:MAG: hypothetical protein CFE38_05320 [Comamonadaceae bacterium PBBC1]|nr:MAG: hypothetical protein CFE38_05320 [Comamonadaceae bacterium PBBC1]